MKYLEKNKIYIDSVRNNKSILKTQQKFKNEMHNVFTEEINKPVLNSNDGKKEKSIDSIETYAYETRKDLVSEKKRLNITV